VRHVDPDRLALLALGERLGGDDEQELTSHLAGCAACQEEVRALGQTVELAREAVADRDDGLRPGERIWTGIVTELGLDAPGAPPTPGRPGPGWSAQRFRAGRGTAADPPPWAGSEAGRADRRAGAGGGPEGSWNGPEAGPAGSWAGPDTGAAGPWDGPEAGPAGSRAGPAPGPGVAEPGGRRDAAPRRPHAAPPPGAARHGPRRHSAERRRWVRSAAALAAAAAIGVLGTLAAVRPWQDRGAAPPPAASPTATLAPVPGGPGGVSGQALVVRAGSSPHLQVTTTGLPPLNQGYYEVWVFDGGKSMVAVGVLGPGSTATLPLPPTLDLGRYPIVDISQEKYDGDQTHSQTSVLRGTLTA
jgi:anti-sigma-K factor RskA